MEKFKAYLNDNGIEVIKPKEIAPGLTRRDIAGIRGYETSVNIDGLTYHITVMHKGKIGPYSVYDMGFSTKEQGDNITNKGLDIYNKVIDKILEIVTFLHEKEGVNIIAFEPGKNPSEKENRGEQRFKLYERTLKNRFPNLRYKIQSDKFTLYLNSLDTREEINVIKNLNTIKE